MDTSKESSRGLLLAGMLVAGAFLANAFIMNQAATNLDSLTQSAQSLTAVSLAMAGAEESSRPAEPTNPSSATCPSCNGAGRVGDGRVFQKCLECNGTGKVTQAKFELPAPPAAPPPKTEASSTAAPKKSAWQGGHSIQVCHGNFCTFETGRMHETGRWFYDTKNVLYRKDESGIWKEHQPRQLAFPNSSIEASSQRGAVSTVPPVQYRTPRGFMRGR